MVRRILLNEEVATHANYPVCYKDSIEILSMLPCRAVPLTPFDQTKTVIEHVKLSCVVSTIPPRINLKLVKY